MIEASDGHSLVLTPRHSVMKHVSNWTMSAVVGFSCRVRRWYFGASPTWCARGFVVTCWLCEEGLGSRRECDEVVCLSCRSEHRTHVSIGAGVHSADCRTIAGSASSAYCRRRTCSPSRRHVRVPGTSRTSASTRSYASTASSTTTLLHT